MTDDKDALPSDQEDGGLKPQIDEKPEPSKPPPVDKKAEQDPSQQPS